MKPDKITLQRIAKAHPAVREELGLIYNDIQKALVGRAVCRFDCVHRSFERQAEIYASGRSQPGRKLTNAPAGLSLHNYGLAVDICLLVTKNGAQDFASWDTAGDFDEDGVADWMEVVRIFKAHGWDWGGDWNGFKDMPHFQKSFGLKASDFLALHKAGSVDEQGYVRAKAVSV